ncbi:uncharacterized protein ACMZJ9_008871 [Mantella aurantiaca]
MKAPKGGIYTFNESSLRDAVHQIAMLQATTRRFIHTAEAARGSSFWGDVEVSGYNSEESSYEEEKDGKKKKKKRVTLAFDSNFFKTQYEFRFPEKAIEVALRRPEERSLHDIRFIRSMMMGILSFRRYSTQMQHMLARVVYYRRFGRGRVVVRKGHRGDSFYFVFSGAIAITQDEDGSSALLDREPILLHKGASFGEVALLKGLRRNATVVCMEDTEFLVVDQKEFFQNKLDQELQKEMKCRFQFFRSLDLLSTWTNESLETLADHCKIEECHYGQVIIQDTHQTKNILFVTKGRCEVLHLVDLSHCPSFHKWIKHHETLLGRNLLLRHSEKSEWNSSVHGAPSTTIKDILPERGVYSVEDLSRRFGLPMSYSEDHGNLKLPKELMAAVYLRIDSLQRGQYFRVVDVDYMESCFEKEGRVLPDQDLSFLPIAEQRDPRAMVILSEGSEVIRVKLDKFSELADLSTLKKLKDRLVPYPSDNDLCRIFLEQNRWKVFKSDLVNQLSSSRSLQPKHDQNQEKGRAGRKGQSVDKRGILQLGTSKAKTEKPPDIGVSMEPPDIVVYIEPLDIVVYMKPPDTGLYMKPPDTGVYMKPPDTGVYMEPPDIGVYMKPPDTGVYMEPPDFVPTSDNDLCRIFLEQNRWKVFKSDLVNQLSSSRRPPGIGVYMGPPDIVVYMKPPDIVVYMKPPDIGIYMGPPDTGVYMKPPDTGVYMKPPDTGVYMEPPDIGVYMEPPDIGVYMEPPDIGVYMEPRDIGVYMESPNIGVYMESPDIGVYMEPPDIGVYMVPPDIGVYMEPPDIGVYMVPPDTGVYMKPPDIGVSMKPQDIGVYMKPQDIGVYMESPDIGFWTTPLKHKSSKCSKDKEEPEDSSPIRLIHAIDIPKLCGKRIMW